MRIAEVAQAKARLVAQSISEYGSDPRFADPGLTRHLDHLPVAFLGARPATQQELDFLLASDERSQRGRAQCLEAALPQARPQHLPRAHCFGEALCLDATEIVKFEEVSDEAPRIRIDHQHAWPSQALQPSCEVWGLADHRLFLCSARPDQITDDNQPGCQPDADL